VIVDSSALVAIMRGEVEAATFARLLQETSMVQVSAATLFETSTVIGPDWQETLDLMIEAAGAEVVAFDAAQSRSARWAYLTYGKGSGSPARLNLGDCFSYALAKTTGQPLLFKGGDFTHTDVTPALR
jgi:ribonuclease VapC